MNTAIAALAHCMEFDTERNFDLRIAFGVACIERVRPLIVSAEALAAMDVASAYVCAEERLNSLQTASRTVARIAASHPGSGVIEGSASAAVSATTGLARALEGRVLDAAGYA